MRRSPYLKHQDRLADVLAAIQVLGSHPWDSREIQDWKTNIGDKPQSTDKWQSIFSDHPEFFGSDNRGDKTFYFLRLRRAYEQTVDTEASKDLSPQELTEYKAREPYEPDKLARRVLSPNQIETLIKAAVELQARAAALETANCWWIPLLCDALGFSGALVGSLLKPTQCSSSSSAQSSTLRNQNPSSSISSKLSPSELRPENSSPQSVKKGPPPSSQ